MRSIPPRLWALSLLSAILQLVPFPIAGPVPLWRRFFCWLCLAPLFYALMQRRKDDAALRPAQAALLGYLCGIVWYAGNCYWIYQTMHIYGNLPGIVSLGILLLFSLYLGLYTALFAYILVRLRSTYSTPVVPVLSPFLWVAVELARARITGFPWDLLGYTQVDNGLLTSLAPAGGVMLLSWIVAASSSLCTFALLAPTLRTRVLGCFAAAVLALSLQAGAAYHPVPDTATHSAVLLQENLSVGAEAHEAAQLSASEKYRQFGDLSRFPLTLTSSLEHWTPSIAPSSHDLIVWPEAPADFLTSDRQFTTEVSALARSFNTPLISGSIGVDPDPSSERGYHAFGSAAVFNSDGRFLGRYDKIHRVPWGEYVPYKQLFFFAGNLVANVGNMEAGTQHSVFVLDGHEVAIFICYESIFGDEVREFVRNGAQVLVNISDDGWYGDTGAPWQHLDMARMRAIENRRWILRDTNTGVTTAIDPHGRGVFTTPRHIRAAFAFPFDFKDGTTFYTRHGDWFAWCCVALVLAFALRAFGRFRRERRTA